MAPKKAKTAPAPAGQPTIGAAFARKSGEHAAAAALAASGPDAAAPPSLLLVRQLGGVVEYSDFAVNNIQDEAGSKPNARVPEADTVDAGACASVATRAPRHAARRCFAVRSRGSRALGAARCCEAGAAWRCA